MVRGLFRGAPKRKAKKNARKAAKAAGVSIISVKKHSKKNKGFDRNWF